MVRGSSTTHPAGEVLLPTQPGWDQLVLAQSGLFTAHARSQVWTVPAHRAICVPDGERVRIETSRRVAIRCLYTRTDLALFRNEVRVVNLTPLVNELIQFAIRSAPMSLHAPADSSLIVLLADQIGRLPNAPLHLPFPSDAVAEELARAIMAEPSTSLKDHLDAATSSRRTLERRFKEDTQMSLGQWRRRACILASVSLLTVGFSVTTVAFQVGYSSASSFIAAFRAELGTSPTEFVRSFEGSR